SLQWEASTATAITHTAVMVMGIMHPLGPAAGIRTGTATGSTIATAPVTAMAGTGMARAATGPAAP
ncbi:MAG: hypothetical protein D6773_08595, partial [Alphaproteobacteria bacterium]